MSLLIRVGVACLVPSLGSGCALIDGITGDALGGLPDDDGSALPDDSVRPGPSADPSSFDAETLLGAFSACMSFEDWDDSDVWRLAAKSTEAGSCAACHAGGQAGFFMSPDSFQTFEASRQEAFLTALFAVHLDPIDGSPRIAANHDIFEYIGSGVPFHPEFDWDLSDRNDLEDLRDDTMERIFSEPPPCDPLAGFPQ